MSLRKCSIPLLILGALFVVGGCKKGEEMQPDTKEAQVNRAAKLGVIVQDKTNPWTALVLAEAEKAAKELRSTLVVTEAKDEASLNAAFTELSAAEVDGIAADVPENLGELLRDGAELANLKLVAFGTRPRVNVGLGTNPVRKLLDVKFFGHEDENLGSTGAMHLEEERSKKGWDIGLVSALIVGADTDRTKLQAKGAREAFVVSGIPDVRVKEGSTLPAGKVLVLALSEEAAAGIAGTLSADNHVMVSILRGASADSFKSSTSGAYVGTVFLSPEKVGGEAIKALHHKVIDKKDKDTMPGFDAGEWITR